MVSGPCLTNNNMDTYKLLDLSGSDSENEVIQFAPMPENPPPQRKKKLKRRERDMLRVLPSQIDEEAGRVCGCLNTSLGGSGPGGVIRSVLLLVSLVGLSLLTWLALHLQARLDATQTHIKSVEASSSELPAKFHESHVRLQELEKNQTALRDQLSQVASSLQEASKKVEKLETDVKSIKDSLSSAPQLSSLPKDVANLQGSVATFGSTLQDVQSSLKILKQDQEKLSVGVKEAGSTLDTVKGEISLLHNQTQVAGGRETGGGETIGEVVTNLKHSVGSLNSAVGGVNMSLHSHMDSASSSMDKLESLGTAVTDLSNVTQRLKKLEVWRTTINSTLPTQVTNLSSTTAQLQATTQEHSLMLRSLNQSMDVVKGVERKLEGSQVQLATGVSDLKQQIQKMGQTVTSFVAHSSTPAPPKNNETHSRKKRFTKTESRIARNKRQG